MKKLLSLVLALTVVMGLGSSLLSSAAFLSEASSFKDALTPYINWVTGVANSEIVVGNGTVTLELEVTGSNLYLEWIKTHLTVQAITVDGKVVVGTVTSVTSEEATATAASDYEATDGIAKVTISLPAGKYERFNFGRVGSTTFGIGVAIPAGGSVEVTADSNSAVIHPDLTNIVGDIYGESPFGSVVWLDATGAATYIIASPKGGGITIDGILYKFWSAATGLVDFTYSGDGTRESIQTVVSYQTQNEGVKYGIPTGVNGEELLNIRIAWDSADKVYKIYIAPVANPTVEYFENVIVAVKIVLANIKVYSEKLTAADIILLKEGKSIDPGKIRTIHAEGTELVAAFDLANRRYTTKDAWKDATGNYRISAADKRPVVESGVFTRAYGKKLTVDYPQYRVIFPTVKNQDVALNLAATITGNSTIALKTNEPILTATFHDIYVKDKVQIEFKVKADAQNYKGTTLYAYELDSDLKPIKAKEVKVTVSDSATIVVEIAANTRLASTGVKNATFGLYGSPQETTGKEEEKTTTTTTTTPSKDTNPTSGPADSISVATAFAVISLAAAGFVAVGKAGKR